MDPVTFAIGGLCWLVSTMMQGAPGGSAGFALAAVLNGILGNEAHRLYREAIPRIREGLAPLSLPENRDLARAVRTAQISALDWLIEGGEHDAGDPQLHGFHQVGPAAGAVATVAPGARALAEPAAIRQAAQHGLVGPAAALRPPARPKRTVALSARQCGG